jgi:Sec7 domain
VRQARLLNNKSRPFRSYLSSYRYFFFALPPGIEYLYENHLLKTDAQDVAQFLYKGEGLNKTAIGKGERKSLSGRQN